MIKKNQKIKASENRAEIYGALSRAFDHVPAELNFGAGTAKAPRTGIPKKSFQTAMLPRLQTFLELLLVPLDFQARFSEAGPPLPAHHLGLRSILED